MNLDMNTLLDDYTNWLRSEISVTEYGEYQEITTPYLDRHNDYLQIYAKAEKDGKIFLTDDGQIINNLLMSGITFRKNSTRKKILDKIVMNHGLSLSNDDLVTHCTLENFPQTKHRMVQAMLLIDDMFQQSPEKVKNIFIDDIADYFDKNDIYPTRDFTLLGKTGSYYTYDFVINKSKNNPERFCRGINKLTCSNRDMAIFNWLDTKEKRHGDDSIFYIIINDKNNVKTEDITAFKNYNIQPIMFSEITKKTSLFVA